MAQNTVQNSTVLFSEDEIVYVAAYSTAKVDDSLTSLTGASWTNIGALSEFSRESKTEVQTPPSQNVEHETVVSKMAETINMSLQELDMTIYNQLSGMPAQSVLVGSSTSNVYSTSFSAAFFTADILNIFEQQNWTSTSATIPVVPSTIVITGSSIYVADQDYWVYQDANKYWGVLFPTTGAFTSTQTIAIAYGYYSKAQNILVHGGADSLTPYMLKTYTIMADNRTITTYYPYCVFTAGGSINDKSQGSGEYKDIKITCEAREDANWTYNSRKVFKVEIQTTS